MIKLTREYRPAAAGGRCACRPAAERGDDPRRTRRAPVLRTAAAEADLLASELGECAGTSVLDRRDDAERGADRLERIAGTVALTTDTSGGELLLAQYAEGSGYAQVGATDRYYLVGTCWQVPVLASGLGVPAGLECSRAVVERAHPSEVLPFDQVDVARRATTQEPSS